jgi:hypothetical protein
MANTKLYRVYYIYPNDLTEYVARIEATTYYDADVKFHNDLNNCEMLDVTVTRIVEQSKVGI